MSGLVIGIIASALAAGLVFMLGKYYEQLLAPSLARRQHALRSILPFRPSKGNLIVVAHGHIPPENKRGSFSVDQGDLEALFKAYQLITGFWRQDQIRLVDGASVYANLAAYQNILSVSGPKWNPVTEYFLGLLGSPARFTSNPRGLVVELRAGSSPLTYLTKREPGQLASECYGLILSAPAATVPQRAQNVVVCAGRTTISTEACLLYLGHLQASKDERKQLQRAGVRSNEKWGVVIRVQDSSPEERLSRPVRAEEIDVDVVKVLLPNDFVNSYRYRLRDPVV